MLSDIIAFVEDVYLDTQKEYMFCYSDKFGKSLIKIADRNGVTLFDKTVIKPYSVVSAVVETVNGNLVLQSCESIYEFVPFDCDEQLKQKFKAVLDVIKLMTLKSCKNSVLATILKAFKAVDYANADFRIVVVKLIQCLFEHTTKMLSAINCVECGRSFNKYSIISFNFDKFGFECGACQGIDNEYVKNTTVQLLGKIEKTSFDKLQQIEFDSKELDYLLQFLQRIVSFNYEGIKFVRLNKLINGG